jgi:2-(1,2-epoxy-1,2-dihydrophenyl)acetyl-CoA isomerase
MAVIRFHRADGVAELTLDSPDRGNAIDLAWVDDFEAGLAQVSEEDRCVLLRAEGRNFCVGGDVGTFTGEDPGPSVRTLAERFHGSLRALADVEIPVLAVAQGWATGAGFSLACAADILVIGQSTRFKTAYNALGLVPDGGLTWRLPRRVPVVVALDLLLTDRVLMADEAQQLGLASRVLPDTELDAGGRAVATTIAASSRHAAVATKRLVQQGAGSDLPSQLDAEASAIAGAASGPDGREGILAFLERRAPRFNL